MNSIRISPANRTNGKSWRAEAIGAGAAPARRSRATSDMWCSFSGSCVPSVTKGAMETSVWLSGPAGPDHSGATAPDFDRIPRTHARRSITPGDRSGRAFAERRDARILRGRRDGDPQPRVDAGLDAFEGVELEREPD